MRKVSKEVYKYIMMLLRPSVVLSILLIAISWSLYNNNASLKRKLAALRESTTPPYIVNGFKPDIFSQCTILKSTHGAHGHNGCVLALFQDDNCSFCEKTMPMWQELIKIIQWQKTDEIWLVSFGPGRMWTPLVQQLEQAHIQYSLLRVDYGPAFAIRTGIMSVPTTLLLDANGAARLVLNQTMTAEQRNIFRDAFNNRLSGISYVALRNFNVWNRCLILQKQ